MNISSRLRAPLRATGLALAAAALLFPASAAANTNEPIAQTGGMTVTIPMLGTSLTVAVTLDAVGNIDGVTLDPADALPTTTTGEHGVKFTNAEGTAGVKVKAKGDKLEVKAVTTLADLQGSGTWAAKVFGAGTLAHVAYTIGTDTDSAPTLHVDSATAPAGIGVVVYDPANGHDRHGKHGRNASARAAVVFSSDGFSKTLVISVSSDKDGKARLSIKLSAKDRQKLQGTLAELAGDRTWSAHLCDGTLVSVAYHVTAEGTVVFDSTVGNGTPKETRHGLRVWFEGSRVGLDVRLKARDDGTFSLKVSGHSGDCGGWHDNGDHHDHDKGHDKDSKSGKGSSDADQASFRQNGGHQHGSGH